MLPAVCETVVVERRKERKREISYQRPPEADDIFSPYALDSTCDVLVKPHVSLIVRQLISKPILLQ